MQRSRMHEPMFPESHALYIIWCVDGKDERYSLAAGHLNAMLAAWDAMADYARHSTLLLQDGSRVLRVREPE